MTRFFRASFPIRRKKDTLWRQYCVLRCCPSVAKTWKHCSDTRNFSEDFQKLLICCPPQMPRTWQNESTFGKHDHVSKPPQCVLVLPALTLKLFGFIVSLEQHFELSRTLLLPLVLPFSYLINQEDEGEKKKRGTYEEERNGGAGDGEETHEVAGFELGHTRQSHGFNKQNQKDQQLRRKCEELEERLEAMKKENQEIKETIQVISPRDPSQLVSALLYRIVCIEDSCP